ncbi:MAG: hypothetical protein H7249_17520 [Chitinophagaceae bacterium]|nr:hypothetical protein [Oligoflexus sp.]
MRMVSTLLKAFLVIGSFAAFPLMAVEKGNLSGFNTGDSSFTEMRAEDDAVRVKVPLKMTLFEQIIVKNQDGIRRIEHKPLTPIRYNFKATIDRTNHFYVSDYHVETVPVKWEHDSKEWTLTVHFYKRFGDGQELEESVGSMDIKGKLEGSQKLYTLKARGQQSFKNKQGFPQLVVEIDSKAGAEKGNIARRDAPVAQ